MLDDVECIVPIEHNIERVFDAGRAGASGVEGQKSHLQREVHIGLVSQHTIERRLPIAGLTDDAVRSSLADLYPVSCNPKMIMSALTKVEMSSSW